MENHTFFRKDEFWKAIPAWENVSRSEFTNNRWQIKNSLTKLHQLRALLQNRLDDELYLDFEEAQKVIPMNIRVTPYILSLIDWNNPYIDPLRKQFLPVKSDLLKDHPCDETDPLHEVEDSPVDMLIHRYHDKVLFLPLATCPVYCSYCTRSRIIGGSTTSKEKSTYGANSKKWENVFYYLNNNTEIEDVVISGGDTANLTASQINTIGKSLLDIPNIRRIRYATKSLAVLPSKITSDIEWVKALIEVERYGRKKGKSVVVHTHFSSTKEITSMSKEASNILFKNGIIVRNQTVLQKGVNDNANELISLIKKLSYMNIQPYYVYIHDMVPGCEHLRTTLRQAIELEKVVRGATAGFNTPTFVCDLPGGGGKRHIASFEHYNETTGISVWKAPSVKKDKLFYYFDPIQGLDDKKIQNEWEDEKKRIQFMTDATNKAKLFL